MYQEHFGLKRPPFKITPDTSLFFEGNQRGAALDALTYAIRSGEGIIKVVGEVGSGKTMLCRMLEVRLNDEVDVVYIANPSLSPDNILHVIAHELHLDVNNEMSKVDVMHKIQTHLLEKHAKNRQVVLFVEEAQSMPIETLEEIRLLSNLETDENKLLQMVLFGQPELDEKLAVQHIRQLKERITHSFNLSPFAPDDTLEYLNFRLRAVGYKGPDIFTKKTANVVKKYSNGLTRRINILADKSLLAAFSEGGHAVTAKHVKSAALDSEFKQASNDKKVLWFLLVIGLLMAAVFAGFYVGQQNLSSAPVVAIASEQPIIQKRVISEKKEQLIRIVEADATNSTDTDVTTDVQFEVDVPATEVALSKTVIDADGQNMDMDMDMDMDGMQAAQIAEAEKTEIENRRDIAGKLKDTQSWLTTATGSDYSIQLFMARSSNAEELEAFLRDIPEMLDFTKIYIYETVISGRPWYGVVYDQYQSYEQAMVVLAQLPASLQRSEPYLRRVKSLKKDAAREI